MAQIVKEYMLTTDEYTQPKIVTDKDAIAVLLLRLLLMVPGDNPDHPEMGVDVMGRYRYSYKSDLTKLNNEIRYQMDTYLPSFNTIDIECTKIDDYIKISINIDNTLFNFTTDVSYKGNDLISFSTDEYTF